jgi:hypothetical protein
LPVSLGSWVSVESWPLGSRWCELCPHYFSRLSKRVVYRPYFFTMPKRSEAGIGPGLNMACVPYVLRLLYFGQLNVVCHSLTCNRGIFRTEMTKRNLSRMRWSGLNGSSSYIGCLIVTRYDQLPTYAVRLSSHTQSRPRISGTGPDQCKAADIRNLSSGLIILHPESDLKRHVWDGSRKDQASVSRLPPLRKQRGHVTVLHVHSSQLRIASRRDLNEARVGWLAGWLEDD